MSAGRNKGPIKTDSSHPSLPLDSLPHHMADKRPDTDKYTSNWKTCIDGATTKRISVPHLQTSSSINTLINHGMDWRRCFIIHIYSQERRLMYSTTIVDLPRIDELLAPAECNEFRVRLVRQSLEAGLDRVHGVTRARHPHGEVSDARKTGNLEHAVGDTETESYYIC